jgi:hypothetical protein
MEAKRWGPFTGRQLTTIIVAVILGAIAVPITANATSTGDDVVITDPTANPEQYAKVTGGKLQVGDNHLKTDILGNLRVAASYGNVTARAAQPGDAVNSSVIPIGTVVTTIASAPSDKAVVITSIHFSFLTGSAGTLDVWRSTGNCNASTLDSVAKLTGTDVGVVVLPFEPGLVLQPNTSLCALKSNSGFTVWVDSNGYAVPASELG